MFSAGHHHAVARVFLGAYDVMIIAVVGMSDDDSVEYCKVSDVNEVSNQTVFFSYGDLETFFSNC